MKNITDSFLLRFLASAVVASIVIIAVVGVGIRYYERPAEDPALANLQSMKILNLAENPQLAEAIRRERERNGTLQPERAPPPPPPAMPERQISGFVHLEYVINPDGSVSDVRVVGAAPAGVYEQQAIATASRQMHAPVFNERGEAIARRTTEIIEFSVPASELRDRGLESR